MTAPSSEPRSSSAGLLTLAWTLVGVPLVYGLVQTIRTAANLFS